MDEDLKIAIINHSKYESYLDAQAIENKLYYISSYNN